MAPDPAAAYFAPRSSDLKRLRGSGGAVESPPRKMADRLSESCVLRPSVLGCIPFAQVRQTGEKKCELLVLPPSC